MSSLLCEIDDRKRAFTQSCRERDQELLDRERSWLRINTHDVHLEGIPSFARTMHINSAVERARQIIGG